MGLGAAIYWVARTWGTSEDGALGVIMALGEYTYSSVAPF